MSTLVSSPAPPEQRLLVSGVPWPAYESVLHAFEGRHLRITYDRGEIEIMTVSPAHELAKRLVTRFVDALTEERDVPILSLGNTTLRREDLERGLEPDDCWYVEHEELMRARSEIDLTADPPPDLALEIEVTRSVLDRVSIYARIRVPEIWRTDGRTLRFFVLGPDGEYTETDRSRTFPQITAADLMRFMQLRGTMDETRLVKEFRAWVRENHGGEREE